MKQNRFTEEQIIGFLEQTEAPQIEGEALGRMIEQYALSAHRACRLV